MILIKSFLTRVLYDCFKLICVCLNEGDKVRECYSYLKTVIQAQLHVGFSTIFIIKRASVILFIYETVAIKHHFETKKIIMKCLTIKILHEIIYSSQFKKYNCSPMHSYNRKIWVGIPSYVTFPWTETYKLI